MGEWGKQGLEFVCTDSGVITVTSEDTQPKDIQQNDASARHFLTYGSLSAPDFPEQLVCLPCKILNIYVVLRYVFLMASL